MSHICNTCGEPKYLCPHPQNYPLKRMDRQSISIEPYDPLESGVSVEYDICICTKDAEEFRRDLEAVFTKYRI